MSSQVCPVLQTGFLGSVYYYDGELFDENCVDQDSSYLMSSDTPLTLGCGNNPDCTPLSSSASAPGPSAGVSDDSFLPHLFPPGSELPTRGLSRLLSPESTYRTEGRTRVLSTGDYRVDGLRNRVRVYLLECETPEGRLCGRIGIGQELDQVAQPTDPALVPDPDSGPGPYRILTTPEGSMRFHVLTGA